MKLVCCCVFCNVSLFCGVSEEMYDGLRLLQLLSTRSLASILLLPNISFHFISRGLNFGANSRKILIANCKVGAGISDQEGISGYYTDGYLSRLC